MTTASAGECCFFACHDPVAETSVVDTVLDGETVAITYQLCGSHAEQSRDAAANRHGRTTPTLEVSS